MNEQIKRQMEELEALKLPVLQARFAEIVGEETKAPNKKYLLRCIGEALEARALEAAENEPTNEPPSEPADDSTEALTEERIDEIVDDLFDNDEPGSDGHDEDEPAEDEHVGDEEESSSDNSSNDSPALLSPPAPDIAALQQRYLDVIGRASSSSDERYLRLRIRQAERGKVHVGPIHSRRDPTIPRDFKVLPVRMESELVDKLDDAWKRHGLGSRMELFRLSLQSYLANVGEVELAALIAGSSCSPKAESAL